MNTDLKSAMTHMDVYLTVARKVKTASFPGQRCMSLPVVK